jgi:hypothetical protein
MASIKCVVSFAVLLLVVSCTSKEDQVIAIVNGKQIKVKTLKESVPKEQWNKEFLKSHIQEVVRKEIISYEANRLSLSEEELFSFFEVLKTRELTPEEIEKAFKNEFKNFKGRSKQELVDMLRKRQYEKAREAYINELMSRSTVRLYLDRLDESL